MDDHQDSMAAASAAARTAQPDDDLFIAECDQPLESPSPLVASIDGASDGNDAPAAAERRPDDQCGRSLPTIGVLLSGGLDSCVLAGRLLTLGFSVQPFYIRCGLAWEEAEQHGVDRFLAALRGRQSAASDTPSTNRRLKETDSAAGEQIAHSTELAVKAMRAEIAPLVVFDQPVADLYGRHWSRTGIGVPDASSADEAVFLPGRNALLLVKPALWCAQRGISRIALAILKGNPFSDATDEFFAGFARSLSLAAGRPLTFLRPCAHLDKTALIRLGRHLPLELSFSCIAPAANRHCGRCNKCAERRNAFAAAGIADRTEYADRS